MPPQEDIWSAARRLAQPFLASLAETDLSGASILDLLRGEGLGYRMTHFYDDLRRYRMVGVQRRYVEGLDPSSSVPRRWMVDQPEEIWHIPETHKGVFEGTMRNIETGETEVNLYDVGFDREISKRDAEAYLKEVIPWEISAPGLELISAELIGWKHLAGASY